MLNQLVAMESAMCRRSSCDNKLGLKDVSVVQMNASICSPILIAKSTA